MNRGSSLFNGLFLGAGLMYFLDPQLGRRRRLLVRDQLIRLISQTDDAISCVAYDITHRAQGLVAESRAWLSSEEVSDPQLGERVRSHLGRAISHPHAIQVRAQNGKVTLSGPILTHEVDNLLACVSRVRGVKEIENRLEPHQEAGNIASLQGGGRRRGVQIDFLQNNWSPATRTLVGATGLGMFTYGLKLSFPIACVVGTAGLGLMARSLTNERLSQLIGARGGRRGICVRKTLTLQGPVERVFPFFASYTNFPRFLASVQEVRDLGRGHSRWIVTGPAGVPVSWNAVITRFEPNQVIAWRSERGSLIPNTGLLRFESLSDDRTRVHIQFAYNPPAGALGHLAAMMFGVDPKSSLDEDLVRIKTLIEEGKTHAPGKPAVSRQDVVRQGT
jgi:uncharacterized membrane protein